MYRRLASIVRTSHTTRRTTRPITTTTTTTTSSTSRPTMRHLSTTNSNSDDNANTNVNVIVNTNTKPSPFKKWPMRMIESQGDYQQDAEILEPIIGGPLYSSQPNLPRLPIPNLIDTIQTFLPTALPLMESEQEARALVEKCKAFPKQAEVLHQKLLERMDKGSGSGSGKGSDTSWLQLWWNQDGYLKIRDPITVNVSYFFHFTDDPSITVNNGDSMESNLQIKRGAAMLHATAEFRKQICSGTWPHQAIGRKDPKTPLCSAAFKYMFHSCRIPKRYMDTYKMYDPSLGEHRHCVVARKGRFYKFDFVKKDGDPIGVDLLEWHLRKCVQMADDAYVTANADANVNSHSHSHLHTEMELGWLTSSDRDSWADAREEILRVGGMEMQQALEWLESGALLLCLDDDDVEPFSKKQCADVFWTGDLASGGNRWFDKSIQLFCTKNGKAGLQGEHSMVSLLLLVVLLCVL
jgi:carnitine O-acetyltransferase